MSKKNKNKLNEPITVYSINRVINKYNEEIYTQIAVQDLMLFGIYSVIKNKETCTFERLVAECFLLFPKVFALRRYPQWPDTLKFDRATRSLREKGLVIGGIGGKQSPGEFKLTEFGISVAKKTEQVLNNAQSVSIIKKKYPLPRSIDDKLVKYLKENDKVKDFIEAPEKFYISESEFRNILRCTLETSERIVKQNLEYFKNIALTFNEKELLEFLKFCENKFLIKEEKNG